ncbi:MAG TPA: PEP/pyruvate-binding domain-containing protein, partial [Symbiobacteriaceae bacterium]|nr:PEP/pyruvate-binding domain-containing protein [Symbiobacteriaceae bacterium]
GCYASLWTPRAVAYRRRLGIADGDLACAVVICEMVDAQAAGVAFTCEPRTGRRDQVVISAAPGLGDELVSGHVEPEEITLEAGRVVARQGRPEAVLTDDQAVALAELCLRVQGALGEGQTPQDIEWAFDGKAFWLLQARPVTGVPQPGFPGAADLPVIWTRGNVKDAFPGVLTPLSWSLMQRFGRAAVLAPMALSGYPVPPGLEVFHRFGGRVYLNLTHLAWSGWDANGTPPEELNRTVGGNPPVLPVPSGDPMAGEAGRRRRRTLMRFLWALYRRSRAYPKQYQAARALARQARRQPYGSMANAELARRWETGAAKADAWGVEWNCANSNVHMWAIILQKTLEGLVPGRGVALASALMSGTGGVVSAEHGYRLADLAEAKRNGRFEQALADYLEEFGHRATYESEIAGPRWREDPSYLLEQVSHLMEHPVTRQAGVAAQQAARAEVARHTRFLRPLIWWLVRQNHRAAAQREAGRSTYAELAEPLRLIALEAGRRMTAAGLITETDDVFYLAESELLAWLNGAWDGRGALELTADRKAWRSECLNAEEAPDHILLHPSGHRTAYTAPPPAVGPDGVLTGLGVAAGQATGPVRVLHHPSEGAKLRRGDVLVAPTTDPGWTPLFLRAAAVIMEVGGYLSHGAIVAREYGIPAVVNLHGASRLFRDGESVTVDGDSGKVYRVE